MKPMSDKLYFRIGDVAEIVGVKPYVLRYWESEFPGLTPGKSNSGQRVYKRHDVETLMMIKHLLYQERYSIEGARRRITELKRDGELKEFRQGVMQEVRDSVNTIENQGKLRALLGELEALSHAPATEFFKY